ncbi:beta-glucosidase [Thermosporothrix hazakensis]|jgi:beta-glucosidase|uniref:beta-glucosidase n=1 Tax=Thermosporothrix hazakensis TaxID=644383 RepID=A0A326U5S0_THEHA|nr:glycoside hydrolase family 3 protein [Thermosporothrix hazakensis]PZW29306.1 beta-glucosidase [Thermosporothrix hazakensis]GCE45343.1 beta-glucosidase [Thermosporothrix hazakensis]
MTVKTLKTDDGFEFRDLNKNGRLDPYEDPRRPIEERVEDLLSQMTLEEKAGMLFQTMIGMNPDGTLKEAVEDMNPVPTSEMVKGRLMNHFNVLAITDPKSTAEWHNRLQALAEETRLGIPVTISSDPRHAFSNNPLASLMTQSFSQWPEPIGLAALDNPELVQRFADIARQEYLAVGIRVALHPQIDLATEPRWSRISGTFGEDAELTSRMVAAYIRGFQGEEVGPESVACMTKHFPGGGPQKDGEDPHFSYGKDQVYPGNNFEYHLKPFEAAFKAGTSQIMPYYGRPLGLDNIEEVGFGFNKDVITGLLRERYGFDGIVCTDWGLLTDAQMDGFVFEARAWGVEHLSTEERAKKALDAGVDQFGGEACPEVIVKLVRSGQIPESRLDVSVRRLLREKFRLGLFDNPYVDAEAAPSIVGKPEFRAAGEQAQRKAFVLLKNSEHILPLQKRPGLKIYIENIAPEAAREYGDVVSSPAEADIAILRLQAPYEQRDGMFLERLFHTGDLSFPEAEKQRILSVLKQVPTVVDIFLDRPAVIPEIAEHSAALLANFGANDRALLDVVFGHAAPEGKLPFELPSSMEAVLKQKPDVPYDSESPLFPFGFGLSY